MRAAPFADAKRKRYHAWIAFTYAGSLTLLFAFAVISFFLLSSIRAYVTGEGFWSKAQKDAVSYLKRYVASGAESDYQQYLASIAIPLADREARLAMERTRGLPITCRDFGGACEAFIRARNHPEDVVWMARLFFYLGRVSYLDRAIHVWRAADNEVLRLVELASALRADRSGNALQQIDDVYDRLTPMEDDFSRTLGEGARWAVTLNAAVMAVATAALILASLWFSRRVLRSLQSADQRYRQYLDVAGDAIFITARDSGEIVEANRMALELSGFDHEQLLGMHAAGLIEAAGSGGNPFLTAAQASGEVALRNAHGIAVLVEVRSTITAINDREVVLSIVRDITEQREFQRRSAEAARMETLGRLAGGVAHDFNNLLAGIMIYASDADHEAKTPRLRRAFEEILRCARSGADLVDQLLQFSRTRQTAPREVGLHDLIEGLESLLRRLVGEENRLELDLDPEGTLILADPSRIEQVITNLTTNARDALSSSGTVTIRTRRLSSEQVAELRASGPVRGEAVLLSVHDDGHGMDARTLARAFDPFFTTKPDGRGTGLGLSSVYGTVRQCGGEVWFESQPGAGTSAFVLLPALNPDMRLAPAGTSAQRGGLS
jgi:PAS domain S-box-containing protein